MYTLRIPFLVPQSTRVGSEEVHVLEDGLRLGLKTIGRYQIFTVEGFGTEQAATEFLDRVSAGLACLLLEKGIAAKASLVPQSFEYRSDPVEAAANLSHSLGAPITDPIDAVIIGSEAAVFITGKTIRAITGGQPSIYVTTPAEQALDVMLAGTKLPGASRLAGDPKLKTALLLYGAYFTEESATAKFLTLVMALESLASATAKAPIALQLLERWEAERAALRATLANDSEDAASLDALQRELFFRRDDSIRSQVRKLVAAELNGDIDAAAKARDAVRLYDLRSVLVHDGHLPSNVLGDAVAESKELVHRVLSKRFQRLTDASDG